MSTEYVWANYLHNLLVSYDGLTAGMHTLCYSNAAAMVDIVAAFLNEGIDCASLLMPLCLMLYISYSEVLCCLRSPIF